MNKKEQEMKLNVDKHLEILNNDYGELNKRE